MSWLTRWLDRLPWRARPERIYECVCGRPLSEADVHRVIETQADTDLEMAVGPGAGTAIIAEFCKVHCPGGCNKECF